MVYNSTISAQLGNIRHKSIDSPLYKCSQN